MLVFVPLSSAELSAWAASGNATPSAGFAVTASMREAFGFATADDEDAEHTALHIAGLASLLVADRRLVAVVETPAQPVAGADFGDVTVAALAWSAVTALFAENAPPAARALHRMLAGATLESAWNDPRVEEFLTDNELLWHGPGEWDALTTG